MKFYSWLALLGFFILYHGVLLMCIVLYSVQVNLNLQAPQLVLFLFYHPSLSPTCMHKSAVIL